MRNTIITICKGIAVCFAVLSLAGAPDVVARFAYQIGIPVLFVCFGYQFKTDGTERVGGFLSGQLKTLYWPFVKWSAVFLILHNLFFAIDLIGGNGAAGTVAQSYGWQEFAQRFWSICFSMSGQDEQLCGNFWILRCLFVSGIAFLLAFKLVKRLRPGDSDVKVCTIIASCVTLLVVWKIGNGLVIPGLAEGGYRELLAVILICFGALLRQLRQYLKSMWLTVLGCLAIDIIGCCYWDASFAPDAGYAQFFAILLTSVCSFIVVHQLATLIDRRNNVIKTAFLYVGDRMLHVLAFSLIAFKLVSAIKVACYGLPWSMVGGYPVVQHNVHDWFWVLYLIAGACLPLGVLAAFRYWASRVDLSFGNVLLYVVSVTIRLICLLAIGLKKLALWIWESIVGIYETIRDIVKASNPKDE